MYHAHRGMMPQHSGQNPRLTDLLEQIKHEFELQGQRVASSDHERETNDFLRSAVDEMNRIQEKAKAISDSQHRREQEYEMRIRDLQHELSINNIPARGRVDHQSHGAVPQAPPPSIGHGPRDLFGQIMQGGQGQAAALGAPPPAPDQPQGLPPHLTQNAAMNTGPPQPHTGFGGYPPGPGGPGPTLNGYPAGPPPPLAASPGPGRGRHTRGPPGVGTPSQNTLQPFQGPPSPRSHMPTPPPGHHAGPPPGAPPYPHQSSMTQMYPSSLPDVGNELWKLHDDELYSRVPPHLKKEKFWADNQEDKWWAIFNPRIPRELDIDLMQTLAHDSVVCCVRFSRDGQYIATGCNRKAQIYDANTAELKYELEDPNADREGDLYIRSVCFSPDGKLLATGAEDRLIRVWDIEQQTITVICQGHTQDIYSLDFSSNGRTIASGSGDKSVRLWDVESGRERFNLEIEDGVTTVALSSDGRFVAAGSLDQSVRVWDAETAAPLDFLAGEDGHRDSVYSVAFSPNKDELVSGSLDRTIKLWSLDRGPPGSTEPRRNTGRCIRTFHGHADYVLSVGLTHDMRWVFSGSKDRGVQFWDPRSGVAHLHLCGHRNSVISVAPSPSPGVFATGSGDQKARIWRISPYQGSS